MIESLKYIRQALSFVWVSSKRWTIFLVAFQLLQAVLPLFSLYLIKLIVDSVVTPAGVDFSAVLRYVILFGLVQLIQAVLQNYQQLTSETQQQLVIDYISTIIIDKAASIDISYYENAEYHDTFHRAQEQALYRPVQILQNLTDLLKNGFLIVSLAVLLFYLHWSVAIILVVLGLPIAFVRWYYSKKLHAWQVRRTQMERESYYLNHILTSNEYAKEVRLFNLGPPLRDRFTALRKKLFKEKFGIGKQRALAGLWAKIVEVSALVITLGFIVWKTLSGEITTGDLVMYFQAFQRGQAAIHGVLLGIVGLYNNRLFLQHLMDLLDIKSLLVEKEQPQFLPKKLETGIQIKEASFTYPNTENCVLEGINLELKKGQVTALVGENGSGKTTLIKLLGRLYDPQEGAIIWDGVDIKNCGLADLRQRVSVIYQDFASYYFSVAENIAIGEDKLEEKREAIQAAARKSGAADFIASFPEKYDQQLGRWFSNGAELSGGQWQKIALARAFFKEADLIILDEPSSAIDPLAEHEIFKQMREMAKDKILVLVTHRLYNLKIADQIVVLSEGKIVEQGTHESLMKKQGLYGRMFEKQG